MAELGPLVAALFPGAIALGSQRLLSGSGAVVDRVGLQRAGGPLESVIVKQYVGSGEGYVREAAALAALPPGAATPVLLADRMAPPVVAMTDLGIGPSLAGRLTGADPAVAGEAVIGWATALADLHAQTLGSKDRFVAELAARAGDLPVAADSMRQELTDAGAVLGVVAADLGLDWPAEAGAELVAVSDRLRRSDRSALSPTDTCPDNNVFVDGELRFLDFEGASFWPIAWDAAYLTVPFPSCWCAWRLPDEVAAAAMSSYRSTLAPALPYVATEEFLADVAAATVAWTFLSASWFLREAMDGYVPTPNPLRIAPSRPGMMSDRLARTAQAGDRAATPRLQAVAEQWLGDLQRRWPQAELPVAPAFR